MLSLSSRVSARMARRLARVDDMFAATPMNEEPGGVNLDDLFLELDSCGHQWGESYCTCPACERLRGELKPLISSIFQTQQQTQVQ